MKPNIGIVSSKKMVQEKLHSAVYYDYVHSIHKGGGIPLIIPLIIDDEFIEQVINQIDGLLLPGGIDLDPVWYDQELHPLCGKINSELDLFEIRLVKAARRKNLPILAICRGHQVVNVAYNGDLYQDITLYPQYDPTMIHAQDEYHIEHHKPVHDITIKEGSILHALYGEKLATNSFHHQIINQLGEGLICTATSQDGVIEAFESTQDRFVLGVQWHPEKMVDYSEDQLILFKRFIEECKT